MKTLSIIVLFLLVTVSYALASGGTEVEGLGLMTSFFIAFGVLIVLYQFIPGLMLIGRLLKEIFSSIDEKATDASSK
jgi:hypothetical protein